MDAAAADRGSAVHRGRRNHRAKNSAAAADGKAVYVRGLPPDWDDDRLLSHFTAHGEVESARMLPHKEGQRARAAFVNFASSEDAAAAVLKCDQQLAEDASGHVYWIGCSIKGGVNQKVNIEGFDASVPSEILDGWLFIGNRKNAACEEELSRFGITSVLSILPETEQLELANSGKVEHFRLRAEDKDDQDLSILFDPACAFLERAHRAGGCTLVHCVAGRSRSPSIVLVYLMRHRNMPLNEAFALVRERRPFARPNEGFWGQLQVEELRLFGVASPVPLQYKHLGAGPMNAHTGDAQDSVLTVQLGDGSMRYAPTDLIMSLEQDLATLSAQNTAAEGVFVADVKRDRVSFIPEHPGGVSDKAVASKSTLVQILGHYGFTHAVWSSSWSPAVSRAEANAATPVGRTIRV